MPYSLDDKLVVGISSRALFGLEEADAIYKRDGLGPYREFQRAHEDEPLAPGTGFRLVRALLGINELAGKRLVEVIVMSRNDADSSVRIFNSAEAHGLDITRGALTGGSDPWPYLKPFSASLFLSAESTDVVSALAKGFPAALLLSPPEVDTEPAEVGVRIAFDGDAVLFGDESERIYQAQKMEGFIRHEVEHRDEPMSHGPFRPFFVALKRLQSEFPEGESPVRTALVTSRNAPAHKRVVSTFRAWGIHTDEAFFLGGIDKTGVLEVFRPHIFFDDQLSHLAAARSHIPAGHVIPTYQQPELFSPAELPVTPPRRRSRRTSTRFAATKEQPLPRSADLQPTRRVRPAAIERMGESTRPDAGTAEPGEPVARSARVGDA